MAFVLTLWSNDVDVAREAEAAGIDRIGVDLEQLGKATRQAGRSTWLSPHRVADLDKLRPVLRSADLFVRCNPVHDGSAEEIDRLIDAGVQVLMVPNFTALSEVARFAELVDGRAEIVPLVERVAAQAVIPGLPTLGIPEFHVGLNDLSIDLGVPNRLAVLGMPILDELSTRAKQAGLRFGVGGLARAMDDSLPVPSDLVYAQHARLGSTGALLARSYFTGLGGADRLGPEIRRTRERLAYWMAQPRSVLERSRRQLLALAPRAA